MLRMKPIGTGKAAARRAELYYQTSDAGYYAGGDGLHSEWGGKTAARLGLSGESDYEHFKRLIHGLDPHSGEQLTAKLVENRIPAWDATASVPKGVTTALERGDDRIQGAIWQSVREAMAMVEPYATTRVRVDGQHEDRVTGNLVWYATEHAETRPVEDTSLPEGHKWREMPDWDRHIHMVIPNVTYDAVEDKFKAVKFRPIMDLRRYFDRCFDAILANKLADLGYRIDTAWKQDGRYHSWDIAGIPASVIEKFSRRSAEVAATEQQIIAGLKEHDANAADHLSAVARDQLGATSRKQKRDGLTLAECREYWASRITDAEGKAIAAAIDDARMGRNLRPENTVARATDFAMRHHFENVSAIQLEHLAATALEHAIGSARPEDVHRELQRQGVITREVGGKKVATTKELIEEEKSLAAFAASGRGSVAPIGLPAGFSREMKDGKQLNDGQFNAACGLLSSPNRVNLLLGPAGAGKSSLLAKFDEGATRRGKKITYLATTSDAAAVLARDGFDTKTVAHFLLDTNLQAAARGGWLVVDESSLLGHKQAVELVAAAKKQDLKLIMVGDPMQHASVARGALLRLLEEHGRCQPFRLSEIMRQKDLAYRAAATLLSQGKTLEGFTALDKIGFVREIADDTDRYRHAASDYVAAVDEGKSVIAISPTHAEAGQLTQEIRSQLRDAGKLATDEVEFTRLVAVNASEAERERPETYRPGDVIQFHQNASGYVKGQRLTVTDPTKLPLSQAARFSLYRPEEIALSVGDKLRFTGTVKTRDGEHTLKNGTVRTVADITPGGNLRLDNGWLISKDAGHFRHGFVETSFGAQGRTTKRAIVCVSSQSLPASNQEMAYVASSRASEGMRFYTDDRQAVMDAIQDSSQKLLALDVAPANADAQRQEMEARKRRLAEHSRRVRGDARYHAGKAGAAWNLNRC